MKEHILLVEDNKTLSKLIGLKVQSILGLEIDIAHTMSEAKVLTEKNQYTLAILDLNLPDAPDGEVVDMMLEKKIPSIVLTGRIDEGFRAQMLKKDIIDYVHKGSIDDIDYVIEIIQRLFKNRQYKVMVVDDSLVFRNQMKKMIKNLFFQVFALAHGEEALLILEENPDIKIIITDYNMPVMDGLELTKAVRKKYNKNQLSIFVLSSSDKQNVSAMFLKQGANDFINKTFSKEEFSCRINNAIEALENIDTISNMFNRDYLTGLYNRTYFFSLMDAYFSEAVANDEAFFLALLHIDHFKKINDDFGHDIGDKAIIHVSEILRSNIEHQDIVARFSGEEFCIVLKEKNKNRALEIFEHIRQQVNAAPMMINNQQEVSLTVSIGIALDHEDTLTETINEADAKLFTAKDTGRNKLVY